MPGRLAEIDVRAGQQVKKGDQLALLENIDVDLQLAKLQGSLDENETKLKNLIAQAFLDPRAADEIPQIREQIDALTKELDQQKSDKQRMRLTAPAAGTVFPPPWTRPRRSRRETAHLVWNALGEGEPRRRLTERTLFCQVATAELEAVMVIEQKIDRSLVRDGENSKTTEPSQHTFGVIRAWACRDAALRLHGGKCR